MMTENFENILEHCLERITEKGESIEACLKDYPELASRLEPLLRTAISTSIHTQKVQASPELKIKAKNALLNEVERQQQKQKKPGKTQKIFWRYRWAVPALALLLLLISSGVVIGANKSMPGEPLYSLKTTMEKVRLDLTPSDLNKAKLHVQLAERRTEEMIEMSKNGNTKEAEKLAARAQKELDNVVRLAENMKDEKNWEKQAEKISKKLLSSNALNSGSGLSDEPIDTITNSTEETILKLTTSEVSQAKARIELANQRVDNIIKLSQDDNPAKVDELLQGVEQNLGNLEPLVEKMKSQGDKEEQVEEITTMLENSAVKNVNKFNEKLEKATGDKKTTLERAKEKSKEAYDNQVESLHKTKNKDKNQN